MNAAEYVNSFSIAAQRRALACLYDGNLLAQSNIVDGLTVGAQYDSQIRRYLQILADCDWDSTWAILVWDQLSD